MQVIIRDKKNKLEKYQMTGREMKKTRRH